MLFKCQLRGYLKLVERKAGRVFVGLALIILSVNCHGFDHATDAQLQIKQQAVGVAGNLSFINSGSFDWAKSQPVPIQRTGLIASSHDFQIANRWLSFHCFSTLHPILSDRLTDLGIRLQI